MHSPGLRPVAESRPRGGPPARSPDGGRAARRCDRLRPPRQLQSPPEVAVGQRVPRPRLLADIRRWPASGRA